MNDELGKRMKDNYESRSRTFLTRRMPVIMRLDGRAFHTLTRRCKKPFDFHLHESMYFVAQELCAEIQGAKCAYVQSDEATFIWHSF